MVGRWRPKGGYMGKVLRINLTKGTCVEEEINPQIQCPIHDGKTFGLACLRPEIHRSQTEMAHVEARSTKMNVFHSSY